MSDMRRNIRRAKMEGKRVVAEFECCSCGRQLSAVAARRAAVDGCPAILADGNRCGKQEIRRVIVAYEPKANHNTQPTEGQDN